MTQKYTAALILSLMAMSCEAETSTPSVNENALTLFDDLDMDDWSGFEGEARSATGSLSALRTLERDFAFIHHYYVDSDQLKGERLKSMLDEALQNVESQIDEVQFIVHSDSIVSNVGTRTRTFPIQSLSDLNDMLRILHPIASFLDGALSEDVDRPTVEYLLLNGALSALDPHSILLPPVEAAEMEVDNQVSLADWVLKSGTGMGVTVKQPIEGTPAWDAGLKSEDRIVRIENTSTINMDLDEVCFTTTGKVGEPVTIMVKRTGWTAPNPLPYSWTNQNRSRKGELLEDGIGYLKIQSFHKNVADDMNSFLKKMEKQADGKLNGLVLDLETIRRLSSPSD